MITIIIGFVVLVLAVGLTALYREVGFGRGSDVGSRWPFGNLAVGNDLAGLPDAAFTGFLAICPGDVDALGALYSVAVVAEEWDYPLLVALEATGRSNGWTDRLDALPGSISQHEMSTEQIHSLQPEDLPVAVFLQEGRVLEASVALDSPSLVASGFQRCRYA